MELIINIFILTVGALVSLTAIMGGERFKDGRLIAKGFIAISLVLVLLILGVFKEYIHRRDKEHETARQGELMERITTLQKELALTNNKQGDLMVGINRAIEYLDVILFKATDSGNNFKGVIDGLKHIREELNGLKTVYSSPSVSDGFFKSDDSRKGKAISPPQSTQPMNPRTGSTIEASPINGSTKDTRFLKNNTQEPKGTEELKKDTSKVPPTQPIEVRIGK